MKRRLFRLTRRLEIRPLKASDYRAWREAYLAVAPARNQWDRKPVPAQLTRAKFARLLKLQANERRLDQFYDFVVFRRDTRALIGKVAVMNVIRGLGQQAFLGYRILNPHWGMGFGKEAVKAGIDIAFRDLGVHRIEAGIEPGNVRSIRLARALGLRKEGLKRGAVFLRGGWVDLLSYAALSEDFGMREASPLLERSPERGP